MPCYNLKNNFMTNPAPVEGISMQNEKLYTSLPTEEMLQETKGVDLLFYLLGGLGIFFAASIGLSLISKPGTLIDTTLRLFLNFLCLTGAVYLLGVRRKRISLKSIGLFPPRWSWKWFLIAAVVTFAVLPLRGLFGLLISLLFENSLDTLTLRSDIFTMGYQFSWLNFTIMIIGGGILVPIAEELYFRGLIHNWFKPRMKIWPRILLSSLIFGLAHFDSPPVAAASFILGAVNAFAYEKTDTIWTSIFIHCINNTFALAVANIGLAFFAAG